MADNLKLAAQLHDLTVKQLAAEKQRTAELQEQYRIMQAMNGAIDTKGTDAAAKSAGQMKDALEKINEQLEEQEKKKYIDNVAKSFEDAEKANTKLSESVEKGFKQQFPKSAAIAAVAISGIAKGLQNVAGLARGAWSALSGGAMLAVRTVKTAAAIIGRIYRGLIEMAQEGGGSTELAEAYEKVRAQFGSFKQDVAANVIQAARSMQGELANTGLHTFRIFGTLAERLVWFREMAEKMGATFHLLGSEIAANAEVFGAYSKGLGIAGEEMQAVAATAISAGEPITETLRQTANFAVQMGEAFGLSQKVISRDMGKMMKDVRSFGNMSRREMSEVAVFTRKLGVEFDKVTKVIDKFETFSDAAENSAKLAQAFGVTVDAFQMMQEENPAKQIDMLRKSFFEAGKSADQMSRKELKLIAQQTGLDEATARQVFSMKNMGASYDEITKKSSVAEKKQLSQEEAMSKLADSIERLVKAGGPNGFTGFWDAFIKGFFHGIRYSEHFFKAMMNIRQSLHQVWVAGNEAGRAFTKMFPGFEKFANGLEKLFHPDKIGGLFRGITKELKVFYTQVGDPNAIKKLIERVRVHFKEFLGKEGGPFKDMMEGGKEFMLGLGQVFASITRYVGEQLPKGIQALTDFISGKTKIGVDASGAQTFAGKLFGPIIQAIKDTWPEIRKALGDLFSAAFDKMVDWAKEHKALLSKIALGIVAVAFGPAFIGGIATAFGAGLAGLGEGKSLASITKGLNSAGKAVEAIGGKTLGSALGKAVPIVAFATAAVSISEGIDNYKKDITGSFDDAEKTIGASAAGIVDSLTLGLLPKDFSQKIAQISTQLSSTVFKGISDVFGEDFTKSIKDQLKTGLDIMKAIGDVIKGLVSGDTGKLGDAFAELGTKLLKFAFNSFKFMFFELPVRVMAYAWKFIGILGAGLMDGIVKMIDKISSSLADHPVLRTVFDVIMAPAKLIAKGLKLLFEGIATIGNAMVEFWKDKTSSISKTLTGWWDSFKSWFDVSGWVKVGKQIFEGIVEGIKGIGNAIAQPFKDGWQKAKDFLKIKSPSGLFEDIGLNLTAGVDKGMEKLPDAMASAAKAGGSAFSVDLNKSLGANATSVGSKAITPAIKAVTDMIAKVNELNEILGNANANTISVVPRLQKLATAAGLGQSGQFTIKNKDLVINLDMKIVMETDKVETVILENKRSKIREGLEKANYNGTPPHLPPTRP